ncbi:hypothetical protein O3P69_011245 [Scylla paramamosain]|uniref:Uncharacterized protein n=1 Tax=Scylla paramamosain TaxID=85552 RepID=A0AAW0SU06_SCYPA
MSGDIKEQVVAAIKESEKFSLQLDESTDASDDAQLLNMCGTKRRATLKRTSCSVNDWRRQQQKLSEESDGYIPDGELHEKYKWVRRPFGVHAEDLSEEESLLSEICKRCIVKKLFIPTFSDTL